MTNRPRGIRGPRPTFYILDEAYEHQVPEPAAEQPTAGPPCGNNPNYRLTSEDQAVVDEFKAYLEQRARARQDGAQR